MEIFQTFEYNGRVLQLAKYEPDPSAKTAAKAPSIKAPGAGKFEIGDISLSTSKIIAGETFTLTAHVEGKNIAYIYSEILLHDKSLNQLYGPVAREYIQADRNTERSGVSRPDWDDAINITVNLNPGLRLLTDGVDSAFGFLSPAGYDRADYQLDGLYTSADGTDPRRARLTFDNTGEITDVVAYKDQSARSAPYALTFKQGDQFAPFAQILTQPESDDHPWQITKGLSTPLTFNGEPFRCVEEMLMPGDYLIGLLVQDLDGALTRQYVPLTVIE